MQACVVASKLALISPFDSIAYMRLRLSPVAASLFVAMVGAAFGGIPPEVKQLVVSVAPNWDSSTGKLQRFERSGSDWRAVGEAIPVLYGRNGLAWGRGIGRVDEPARKVERDGRAPAGLFRIGKIYTYDAQLPPGANYPFHQVSKADAWIDDPSLPNYNRHVRIDPANPPAWFEKQKMRHNDFAYRWLVEIRHNSDPPVPGAGSAIFFHIRRGTARPSSGCTTMSEGNLVGLIKWLRADKNPHYVLLPAAEYRKKAGEWDLPDLEATLALMPP